MTDHNAQTVPAPGTSLWAACTWCESILAHNSLGAVWGLTHWDLRQELVEAWVEANRRHPDILCRDPDDIVADLSSTSSPQMPQLWSGFEQAQLRDFRLMWADVDLASWSWEKEPRVLTLDLETVLLIDAGDLDAGGRPIGQAPPEGRQALGLVMSYVDGTWCVMAVTPCQCL
jgi:hypothetical protein